MNNRSSKTNHKENSAIKSILKFILPLIFWLGVWQLTASLINNSFLFPNIQTTFRALTVLAGKIEFYKAISLSTIRVFLGLILGIFMGVMLAVISFKIWIAKVIINPIITVIRSTPVASFIVVLWVIMSGDALSIFIGFLMVMPIIWQSTNNSFDSIDKDLSEVADIYEFSKAKRFKLLIFPTLKRYLVPAIITAAGLAWKAEIAAEIIAYTKKSIGQGINDAKYHLDTPTVFAWTIVIIVFSILLEKGTKYFLRRSGK